MQKNNDKREKAFLVGVILKGSSRVQIEEQLEELKFLADTAGADIIGKFTQNRSRPDPQPLLVKGRLKLS
jgi:GTP-binding protein HflX